MTQEIDGPTLAVEALHEVHARFATSEALNEAVAQLSMAGFDRADLALPDRHRSPDQYLGAATATTDVDSQQARTLATSLAAAAGAMLAGGVVVATGGAAGVAAVAAVAAGGGAGAVAHAIAATAQDADHADRDRKAAAGDLILAVRTPTRAKQDLAETLVRQSGALDIVTT